LTFYSPTSIWSCSSSVVHAVASVNVQANTRINNKCMHSYNPSKSLYYDVNNLYIWIGDVSTIAIHQLSIGSKTLNFDDRFGFSSIRLYRRSRVRSICMTDTLTYFSIQCAISHPASARINFSRRCMINSITSSIIATCSNVLVTVFV